MMLPRCADSQAWFAHTKVLAFPDLERTPFWVSSASRSWSMSWVCLDLDFRTVSKLYWVLDKRAWGAEACMVPCHSWGRSYFWTLSWACPGISIVSPYCCSLCGTCRCVVTSTGSRDIAASSVHPETVCVWSCRSALAHVSSGKAKPHLRF